MRYLKVYEYFFDPDDVQIRWGRTKKEIGHTLRNVIVSYKGDDITGQAPKTRLPDEDLGSWNRYGHRAQVVVWIPDGGDVAYIPTMYLPDEFSSRGIGTEVFRKISQSLGKRLRNDAQVEELGDQSDLGQLFWRNKEEFLPDRTIVRKSF